MIDSAIAILLGVVLVEMARFGGHVSANPPPTLRVAAKYTWRFRLYAVVACILVCIQGVSIYQTSEDAATTQLKLSNSIANLNSELRKSDAERQVDDAYFKAKLEDAYKLNDQMRAFAPAVMKMAETSADLAKKQYEQKSQNNNQLRALTTSVINKLKELESRFQIAESKIFEDERARSLPIIPRGGSSYHLSDEQRQQMNASMQEAMQQAQLLRIQYEKEYRTTVMGDAQYCKRELLSRVGGDGFLSVGDRGKSYAIDGLVTGRDP